MYLSIKYLLKLDYTTHSGTTVTLQKKTENENYALVLAEVLKCFN